MKVLVTGGCGFIGSAFVRLAVREHGAEIVNVDKLTYAATQGALEEVEHSERYRLEKCDVCDGAALTRVFELHQPDTVIHLAAESHVDRSIDAPADFIQTNIVGTYTVLEAAYAYWQRLPEQRRATFRLHHVSTDEVFGSLDSGGAFSESSPYQPSSPYSASKASADHLARAWHHTYGLPVVLSNSSNNYGPYQLPEKFIPVMIINGLLERPLPVYGRGENIRDWLHVDDHATALWQVMTRGRIGESYNVGGSCERNNITVVNAICTVLDELAPRPGGVPHSDLVEYVEDRPGHDLRYAIDPSKIQRELDWSPEVSFGEGLRRTVAWYLARRDWWEPLRGITVDLGRRGAGRLDHGTKEQA